MENSSKNRKPRRTTKKGTRNVEEFQIVPELKKYIYIQSPLPLWYTNNNNLENAI